MERLDEYQKMELERSWSNQLDRVGMQPHAREYLESEMNCVRSYYRFEQEVGQDIDYSPGIQFSGCP